MNINDLETTFFTHNNENNYCCDYRINYCNYRVHYCNYKTVIARL